MFETGTVDSQADLKQIAFARSFAVVAHGDQMYGHSPYVVHLDQVHFNARKFGAVNAVLVAAYLHDVVEDTEVTLTIVNGLFGVEVMRLVAAVTDEPGRTRMERHTNTYPKTRAAGLDAIFLKLCDRIANVQASIGTDKMSMYRGEVAVSFEQALRRPREMDRPWVYLDGLNAMDKHIQHFWNF